VLVITSISVVSDVGFIIGRCDFTGVDRCDHKSVGVVRGTSAGRIPAGGNVR
jgi:hypothetical protein